MHGDDGIVFRLPDIDRFPPPTPREAELDEGLVVAREAANVEPVLPFAQPDADDLVSLLEQEASRLTGGFRR